MIRFLPWLAVTVTLGVATAIAQQPDQPAFRTGVDLVSLNVTVTDSDNRYVTDIEQPSFQLYEDGALQDITFYTRTQLPIALALLIDTSASMSDKMSTAQQAAIGFAERMRDEDSASVIDFDSRVDILQGFTNSIDELKTAIRRTSAGGSTSLYNAIYISLKELASVLIPGVDSNSLINLHAGCEEPNSAILAMAFFRSSTDDTTAPRIALAIERG